MFSPKQDFVRTSQLQTFQIVAIRITEEVLLLDFSVGSSLLILRFYTFLTSHPDHGRSIAARFYCWIIIINTPFLYLPQIVAIRITEEVLLHDFTVGSSLLILRFYTFLTSHPDQGRSIAARFYCWIIIINTPFLYLPDSLLSCMY